MEYKITKFWQRIFALLIDFLILGIIGFLIGLMLESFLISIGRLGLLFGLLISTIYFSLCNANVFSGQTIGKKALNIHVIRMDGSYLSIKQSFMRAIVLCPPYFLINLKIPGLEESSLINIGISIFGMALMLGIIIFYIQNNSTRQSLHDLLVKSYVTQKEKNESLIELTPIKKAPFYTFGILSILFIGVFIFNIFNSKKSDNKVEFVYEKLEDIKGVINASTSRNTTTVFGENKSTTVSFVITLGVQELPDLPSDIEDSEIVKEAIEIVFNNVEDIDQLNSITVKLTRGFDIGIAKKYHSFNTTKSPSEWNTIKKQR